MAVVPKHYNSKGSAPVNKIYIPASLLIWAHDGEPTMNSAVAAIVRAATSSPAKTLDFIYWGGPLAVVVFWHNGHSAMGQPLRLTKGAGARTRGPCACLP